MEQLFIDPWEERLQKKISDGHNTLPTPEEKNEAVYSAATQLLNDIVRAELAYVLITADDSANSTETQLKKLGVIADLFAFVEHFKSDDSFRTDVFCVKNTQKADARILQIAQDFLNVFGDRASVLWRYLANQAVFFDYYLSLDLMHRSQHIKARVQAFPETKEEAEGRILGLSQRAQDLLKEGALFISETPFSEAQAQRDFEYLIPFAEALSLIIPWLAKRGLIPMVTNVAVRPTRNGTSGSFGGPHEFFSKVIMGSFLDAYNTTKHYQFNTPMPTWGMLALIINLQHVRPNKESDIPADQLFARMIEELIQGIIFMLVREKWGKHGFAAEELIAETILASITKAEIIALLKKKDFNPEWLESFAENKSLDTSLAECIPEEERTVPLSHAFVLKIFSVFLKKALKDGNLAEFVYFHGFTEFIQAINLSEIVLREEGSDNFLAESLSDMLIVLNLKENPYENFLRFKDRFVKETGSWPGIYFFETLRLMSKHQREELKSLPKMKNSTLRMKTRKSKQNKKKKKRMRK